MAPRATMRLPRITALLPALLLLPAMGPVGSAGPHTDLAPIPLPLPFPLLPGVLGGPARCGGTAPAETECVNGLVLPDGTPVPYHVNFGRVSHGFDRGDDYTGSLQSDLVWFDGAQSFRCTISSGTFQGCTLVGAAPPIGVPFAHVCASYERGTSTPGGTGAWACWFGV